MEMIATKAKKTTRSRWLDWQPATRITVDQSASEATKPSKPSFVGFVGAPPAEIYIKHDIPARVLTVADDAMIPPMPPGISLVAWKLKEPPVAIETSAVVVDTALFAKSTLEQLRIALTQPKRWVGWSAPQLVDRLAQVGVLVTLELDSKTLDTRRP
jgi:hypothetical protein